MSLRRLWLSVLNQLIPNLAVVVQRTAAGDFTGILASPNPVTVYVAGTGQEVVVPAGGQFTVSFPAAGIYTLRFYSTSNDAITYINLDGAGVRGTEGDADGCFDSSRFLNLAYANVSGGYVTKAIGYYSDAFYLRSGLNSNATLDITQVNAARLFVDAGKWTSISWPADLSRLTYLNAGSNRLTGTFNLGAAPVLKTLQISSDSNATRLTTVNITGSPLLEVLDVSQNRMTSLLYDSTGWQQYFKTFSGRFSNLTGVAFSPFVNWVSLGVQLTTLDVRECQLTGAELEALIDAILANAGSRPGAGVSKSLRLEGTTPSQLNEAIVRQNVRDKISTLSSQGWVVAFNRPTLGITRLDANTLRLTYTGTRDITIWAVGDTIRLSASVGVTGLVNGDYQIVAGGGKVWDISNATATVTSGSATGTFDKI